MAFYLCTYAIRLIFFLSGSMTYGIYYTKQPVWDRYFDCDTIEAALIEGKIVSISFLKKSSNRERAVFLVMLSNGLKAVFKQRDSLLNYAEVFAYKINRYLDQKLVPPTVIKTIDGKEGSLQLFVESSYFFSSGFDTLSKKNKSDYILFSYIFGRSDWNKRRNIIIQKNNGRAMIAAIDNERIGMVQKGMYGYGLFLRQHQFILPTKDRFSFTAPVVFDKKLFKQLCLDKKIACIRKKSQNSYVVICDNGLWTRGNDSQYAISYVSYYCLSTIEKYRKLDAELLKNLWNINCFYDAFKDHVDELIKEILIRRNQVLVAIDAGQMQQCRHIS